MQRVTKRSITTDFLETMQTKKRFGEKNPHSVKLSFNTEGKIKSFWEKRKLRKVFISRPGAKNVKREREVQL